jgi:amidohydrolase
MDAVSTVDKNGNTIVAHLCGHDAHMAVMLGLCEVLIKNQERFGGTVKLLFQPAEEALGGAATMIAEGVLDDPRVDRVYGFHMWSEFETGKACATEGPLFAAGDQFSVSFSGVPGHAAMPHSAVDVILARSAFVQNLQAVVSRKLSLLEPGVISVCQFKGGSAPNTMPQALWINGTTRSFSEETRGLFESEVKRLARSTAAFYGADAKVEYRRLVPYLVNTPTGATVAQEAIKAVLSRSGLVTGYRTTCVDDFSFYLRKVQGAYILIGCRGEVYRPVHHNDFYVTDDSLMIALTILHRIVRTELFV